MGRRLGWLLPGVPDLLRGRVLEGGVVATLWIGLLALALVRFDRVWGAIGGSWGDRIGLLALTALLVGIWARFHGVGRGRPSEYGTAAGRDEVRTEDNWTAFKGNRLALMGLGVVLALCLAALLAPFLAPFDPYLQFAFQGGGDMALRLAPPSVHHLMGTDQASRDVFSRILYGARISLAIGISAVAISATLGALLGAVAGYLGGWVDAAIMRFVDVVLAFPRIVLLIVLIAVFGQSIFLIIAALSVTQWPFTARIVRGEIMAQKEREYAEAARALGFSRRRILFRHLLPNALAPVIVFATLGIGNTIVLEAGLSFLGLGVRPPTPSWGTMIADGWNHL